jgi:hypothetical protein
MVGGARPSPWPPDISACCAAASDEIWNMRTFHRLQRAHLRGHLAPPSWQVPCSSWNACHSTGAR